MLMVSGDHVRMRRVLMHDKPSGLPVDMLTGKDRPESGPRQICEQKGGCVLPKAHSQLTKIRLPRGVNSFSTPRARAEFSRLRIGGIVDAIRPRGQRQLRPLFRFVELHRSVQVKILKIAGHFLVALDNISTSAAPAP